RHALWRDGLMQHGEAKGLRADTGQLNRLLALGFDEEVACRRQVGGHGAHPAVAYQDVVQRLRWAGLIRGGTPVLMRGVSRVWLSKNSDRQGKQSNCGYK